MTGLVVYADQSIVAEDILGDFGEDFFTPKRDTHEDMVFFFSWIWLCLNVKKEVATKFNHGESWPGDEDDT
jgi:hypothetical protein